MAITLIATLELKVTEPRPNSTEWVKGPAPVDDDIELLVTHDYNISDALLEAFVAEDDYSPSDFETAALRYDPKDPDFPHSLASVAGQVRAGEIEVPENPRDVEDLDEPVRQFVGLPDGTKRLLAVVDEVEEFLALPEESKNLLRIEKYLERHVRHLRENRHDETMFHARFNGAGEDRFKRLQKEDADGFREATLDIARRMHEESTRAVNNGILVAVRRTRPGDEVEVVVLKLDVHNPAARLARVERHVLLAPVRDLLDLPEGQFPKAAVYPDEEPASDVMVVDQHRTLFFLRAIEAQLFVTGVPAVEALTRMLKTLVDKELPAERARLVGQALERVRDVSKGKPVVASKVVEALDMLSESQQEDLASGISKSPITFERIAADVERRVRLGGTLELRGKSSEMSKRVSLLKKVDDDGWQMVVTLDKKPRLPPRS